MISYYNHVSPLGSEISRRQASALFADIGDLTVVRMHDRIFDYFEDGLGGSAKVVKLRNKTENKKRCRKFQHVW